MLGWNSVFIAIEEIMVYQSKRDAICHCFNMALMCDIGIGGSYSGLFSFHWFKCIMVWTKYFPAVSGPM